MRLMREILLHLAYTHVAVRLSRDNEKRTVSGEWSAITDKIKY